MNVAEARAIVAQAEAKESKQQKADLRKKLELTLAELEMKRVLKAKVDRALDLAINMRQGIDEAIQQMLALLGQHTANRPSHGDVLPTCECKECITWRNEEEALRRGHARLLERKREAFSDPNADAALQRDLAVQIVNLERSVTNIEARLRGQPNGATRFEGSLGAVR
jgi:hypothetical protein